jgi:nucleotide-binding universal stress UspA family protein
MSCKTILLHLHDISRAERLLRAAVPLARAHEAHLIALAVIPPYVVIPASESAGMTVTIDEHRLAYRQDITKLKARFEDAGKAQQLSIEWREIDAGFGTTAAQVMEHGRSADLVVVAQKDPDWSYTAYLEEPERIAIECGRPVLIVPNKGNIDLPPKRVLIAWNGTREAARAVADATPYLPRGTDVTVLWVDPDDDRRAAGDVPGADLCTSLARHGLSCDAMFIRSTDGDAGGAILREAAIRSADLIVMGAYGHSRLREFLLGGASRDMFARMDRPVLMSH